MILLTPSFQQLKSRGGPCLGINSNLNEESERCPFWSFFLSPTNEPNNEAPHGQRWFDASVSLPYCFTMSPLLSLHAINNSLRDKIEEGGLDGKESACNVGDSGSNSGSGRSPAEGNGYPLQYSCLGNPVDRGALVG